MQAAPSLATFLLSAENRAAVIAVQSVETVFRAGAPHNLPNPLVLHGPGGTGKSHLAAALLHGLMRFDPRLTLQQVAAQDWKELQQPAAPKPVAPAARTTGPADASVGAPAWLEEARRADYLVIEDMQHLPERSAESMVQLLEARCGCQLPTLVTSRFGPRQLHTRLGPRLASRLAAGLVVALDPLQAESRLPLVRLFGQRRQLAVRPEILEWLATHLPGGGRQLEGAVAQLDTLTKMQRQPLQLGQVQQHFRAHVDALRPNLQRIVEHVGSHFHVTPADLASRRRLRSILVPRQISMYLARRLTRLSLQQIGAALGGHDHSTVLHACRKIQATVETDAVLSGTVRQLQAGLT